MFVVATIDKNVLDQTTVFNMQILHLPNFIQLIHSQAAGGARPP